MNIILKTNITTELLTTEEKIRYNRHLILEEFGAEAQQKLKDAKVLVVGAGGLGAPVLQYLTAAGVGQIGIIDGDKIDESNLQRQVIFNHADIDRNKALTAKEKLTAQNPLVKIEAHEVFLSTENAVTLFEQYDYWK